MCPTSGLEGVRVRAEGISRVFVAVQWYEIIVLIKNNMTNRGRIEGVKGEENSEINLSRHA